MPAQILPLLDLSEQAQKGQQMEMESQRLQMQEQSQALRDQLDQIQSQTQQAQAPLHAQLLQQELSNQRLSAQSALQTLQHNREMGPLEIQNAQTDQVLKNQQISESRTRQGQAQSDEKRLDDKHIMDMALDNIRLKTGQRELDQQGTQAAIQQATLAKLILGVPQNERISLVSNMLKSGVIGPDLAAGLAAEKDKPESEDELIRENLPASDYALYRSQVKLAQRPDERSETEKLSGKEPAWMTAIKAQEPLISKALASYQAKRSNPQDLPQVVDPKTKKSSIDVSELIKGVVYKVQNPSNPREVASRKFIGLDSNDMPQWDTP